MIKKAIAVLLVMLSVIGGVTIAVPENGLGLWVNAETSNILRKGTCGANITWTFDDEGTLVISGNGNMSDYKYSNNPIYGNNSQVSFPWTAFYNSINKVIICDGVNSIGNNAFRLCRSLTSVEIPSSVIRIGEHAFDRCESLTDIEIPPSVCTVEPYAFTYCLSLKSIEIPSSIKLLDNYIFSSCSALTDVYIPSSITEIGEGVFSSCTSLGNVTIPGSVEKIGWAAFAACKSLKNVNIQPGVKHIDDRAFMFCSSLESIILPDSVKYIGLEVFHGCPLLEKVVILHRKCTIATGLLAYQRPISDEVYIYGYSGSTAQSYARRNQFVAIDAVSASQYKTYDDTYSVYVTDDSNMPVKGATVTISGELLPDSLTTITDSNGRATFSGLADSINRVCYNYSLHIDYGVDTTSRKYSIDEYFLKETGFDTIRVPNPSSNVPVISSVVFLMPEAARILCVKTNK